MLGAEKLTSLGAHWTESITSAHALLEVIPVCLPTQTAARARVSFKVTPDTQEHPILSLASIL